jgi:hypothetical protein
MIPPTVPVGIGDFCVVSTATSTSGLIDGLEWLSDAVTRKRHGGWEKWDHALVCTDPGDASHPMMIVEAEPGGAVERPWHYDGHPHQWSSGIIALTPAQRTAIEMDAHMLADRGTGYGWIDYLALVDHALHIPAPGLKRFIGSSHTLICSQLVDRCYQRAGVQLFDDGRWPGYVMPSDLGSLLSEVTPGTKIPGSAI